MVKGDVQSYLPKDDFRRVADVRRAIWTAGFQGALLGLAGGALVKPTWAALHKLGHIRLKPEPRHTTFCILLGGVSVMFLGAVTAGKNSMQEIGDVLQKNSTPVKSQYQQLLPHVGLGKSFTGEHTNGDSDAKEMEELRRISLRDYGWDLDAQSPSKEPPQTTHS